MGGSASHRVDGDESPVATAKGPEVLLEGGEVRKGSLVGAGDDIPGEVRFRCRESDGARGAVKGQGVLAESIMFGFESVKADGHRAQSGVTQGAKTLGGKGKAVGDDAPRIAAVVEGASDGFEVGAHERFAAGDDNHQVVGIDVRGDLRVDDMQEVRGRHVGCGRRRDAVAAAMEAVHVTTEGRFPKQLLQGVQGFEVATTEAFEF